MINKILNYIFKPFRLIAKIKLYFEKKNYDKNIYIHNQNEIFSEFNLSREQGLKKYNETLHNYKFIQDEMSSEHQVFFSSLSLLENFEIKEILEIGTWDAKNAFLLSVLFKNASIDTIDLKKDHNEFKDFYNRNNKVNEFVKQRDEIIFKEKRIHFKELNSLRLYNYDKKYDLIWIDGAHGYPVVCMDIINSLKLLNPKGIIMCDDIFINKIKSDKMYQSIASFETLNELKKEDIIDFKLIYKRLDAHNNSDSNTRKFVAIVKLNNNT